MSRLGFVASVLASTCGLLLACGGRSELDDYSDGVPSIVPASNAAGNGGGNGDGDQGDGDQGDGDQGDGDQGDGDGDTMSTTGADVGEACDKDGDCMGGDKATCIKNLEIDLGFTKLPIMFPGGSCAITDCKSNADCPKGAGCLSGFAQPACTKLCNDAKDCRADEGYTCGAIMFSMDTRKVCQPPVELPF